MKKIALLLAISVLFWLCLMSSVKAQNTFWVSTREDVFVRPSIDNFGLSVALLRYGDTVQVTRCIPNCEEQTAWVELAPFGATRLSNLSPIATRTAEANYLASGPVGFLWAKVINHRGVTVGAEHFGYGDELFFVRETPTSLVRANGLEIPKSQLDMFEPSSFSGWVNPPQEQFVFAIKDTVFVDGLTGQRVPIHRYDRFPVELYFAHDRTILINNPRSGYIEDFSAVRYGYGRYRPDEVPQNAPWVHVDLAQQILTAYDRNNNVVFATLVSSGSARHPTRRGTFPVRRKISYTQMRGGGGTRHSYSVEGVPWVMYFDDAIALHGAFWHDQFGTRRSHGCVNLSIQDAKWLFDYYTNIDIPNGWRSVHPIQTLQESDNLWVVVE